MSSHGNPRASMGFGNWVNRMLVRVYIPGHQAQLEMLAVSALLGLGEAVGEYLIGAELLEESVVLAETADGALAPIEGVTVAEGEGVEGGEAIQRRILRDRWRDQYEAGGPNRPGNPNNLAAKIKERMPRPRFDSVQEATEESVTAADSDSSRPGTPKRKLKSNADNKVQPKKLKVENLHKTVKFCKPAHKRKNAKPVKL